MQEVQSSELKRGLSARHIRFIALGSAIGTGLFYGSAKAIQAAGPSVLIAYLIAGAAVYMVMRALGEMAVHNPVAGSFGQYASQSLGPLAGFITGWTYTFEMIIVCLADVTAFGLYMGFWYPDVPQWIWVLAIVLLIGGLNLCTVKLFGELEFWLSLLKVAAIVAMIAGGLGIMLFGIGLSADAPATGVHNLWQNGGFMPNGIGGLIASLAVVVFALAASRSSASRPARPRTRPHHPARHQRCAPAHPAVLRADAVRADGHLPWSQIGSQGSPFVQIFDQLGIPSAATILNIVVISAAVSAINSDIFGAGRMLYGMAQQGQAPRGFAAVSRRGVPWMTVVVMSAALLIGVVLNYLIPKDVFLLIASIATFATVWVWLMILLSQFNMRRKMDPREAAQLKFPVPLWPAGPILAIAFMVFVILVLGYFPNTQAALIVGAVWIALLCIAYRLWVLPQRKAAQVRVPEQGAPQNPSRPLTQGSD